jgi:hypothetical protein
MPRIINPAKMKWKAASRFARESGSASLHPAKQLENYEKSVVKSQKSAAKRRIVNTNHSTPSTAEEGRIYKLQQARKNAASYAGNDKELGKVLADSEAPVRSSRVRKTRYSKEEREAIATKRQANQVRGHEEATRRATEKTNNAKAVIKRGASNTSEMEELDKAYAYADKHKGRFKDVMPETKGSVKAGQANGANVKAGSDGGGATIKAGTDKGGSKVKSSKLNLEPGGKPQENMWGQTKATGSMMWDNFTTDVGKNGGNYASYLAGATMKGAVWGGAIGGTMSAAQGGDFWSGAKEGAFKGAAIGAGYKGMKAATKADDLGGILENGKAIWQYHGKGNVSNSVHTITKVGGATNLANKVMNQ